MSPSEGPTPDQRQTRIDVVVVNYGTAELAIAAVQSVLDQDPGTHAVQVHLVDNASPGDDAARLQAAHRSRGWNETVRLWPETQNHGFGRGNNVVLEALASEVEPPDYVYLLNPDACLHTAAPWQLGAVLDADPQAAAAGSAVMQPDLTPQVAAFRFPGLRSELARIVNLSLLNRIWKSALIALPPDHPAGPVDWVSGASVMFRFDAIRQVGFFDPAFFLYYEEVDLMRRLRAAGWHSLYVPQAQVVHAEGAATGQFGARRARQRDPAYLYQSWAQYFGKAFGRAGAVALAVALVPAALINMMHRGVRGRPPTVPRHFLADHLRYVILPLATGRAGG